MPLLSDADARSPCSSCQELYPRSALDRYLWCPPCRTRLERRVRLAQHLVALLVTLPFLVWILLEGTRGFLPRYAWLIPLAAAYYLGMRIGRELARGIMRARGGVG